MRELRADDAFAVCDQPFFDALIEKTRDLPAGPSIAPRTCVSAASAKAALAARSANAISGSIIQNSARWRLVFEFSARKVGPMCRP
jgi:hypothetical protein